MTSSRQEKDRRHKIGRNDICPCGSKLKYKKCCLQVKKETILSDKDILERQNILDYQRRIQQGKGRGIVSCDYEEQKIVAVGNKIFLGKFKTFHDFLPKYLADTLGANWENNELKKPYQERHPILQLYDKFYSSTNARVTESGKITSGKMTGATACYLWLAYNLYSIQHNVGLQSALVNRLKNEHNFLGAYYETYVAGIFIRAGFEINFEDESDRSNSYCEFVARHKKTGIYYSVEVKISHRESPISKMNVSKNYEFDIYSLLNDALKKSSKHQRIVFIDVNLPSTIAEKLLENNQRKILSKLKKWEVREPLHPPAYLFLTNYCYHYDLDEIVPSIFFYVYGFKLNDFLKGRTITLTEAIDAKEKHSPIYELYESLEIYNEIPCTFNGEVPHEDITDILPQIGDLYVLNDGVEIKILNATVSMDANIAWYVGIAEDKAIRAFTVPLQEEQMRRYKRYPETFFGQYQRVNKKAENAQDMYEFWFEGFKGLSKNELLKRLENYPNYSELLNKTQLELLRLYCESITNQLWKDTTTKE